VHFFVGTFLRLLNGNRKNVRYSRNVMRHNFSKMRRIPAAQNKL
jgi:hypothetical protein